MAGLLLVAVLGAAGWLLLRDPTYVAPPSSAPHPEARPAGAASVLHGLERAVREDDVAAARALGADDRARELLAAVVTDAQRLRVSDLGLRYVDEAGGVSPSGDWQAYVDTSWRFAGFDRTPAHAEVRFGFVATGDRVRLTSIGGGDRRSPLWLTAPVQVRRTPDTLVLVAGSGPEADRYARLARRAVPVVRQVLPGWHGGLVVEVPASAAALQHELDATPGEYASIAAVTTTPDGSSSATAPVHVFVNPEVFGPLRPEGSQVVMSHEATHVATGAATSEMPLWLLEGFADYVALLDVHLPLSTTAGQIIAEVRRDGAPDHLPGQAEFDTGATHLGATYESAWLAVRLLGERRGSAALVRFYDDVAHGSPLSQTLRRRYGIGVSDLTREWRQRLSDLAS